MTLPFILYFPFYFYFYVYSFIPCLELFICVKEKEANLLIAEFKSILKKKTEDLRGYEAMREER